MFALREGFRNVEVLPVQEACRDYGIVEEVEFGVWGGMSTPQRRQYAFQQASLSRAT